MSDEPRCIAIDPPPAAQAREAEVTHLLDALRHELLAEQYARVQRLHLLTDDVATDRATHWQDHLLECLMAHFPASPPRSGPSRRTWASTWPTRTAAPAPGPSNRSPTRSSVPVATRTRPPSSATTGAGEDRLPGPLGGWSYRSFRS